MSHVLLLSGASALLASAQSGPDVCAASPHAIVLYAPESNLERREIETLRAAKVSVDIAMYSFTDRDLAEELVRLAKSGVRVRAIVTGESTSRRNSVVPPRPRC
jgi:phosphatidylserine/phosphatidylglycerophosphate/cardiolipin synthase-like enzyme